MAYLQRPAGGMERTSLKDNPYLRALVEFCFEVFPTLRPEPQPLILGAPWPGGLGAQRSSEDEIFIITA